MANKITTLRLLGKKETGIKKRRDSEKRSYAGSGIALNDHPCSNSVQNLKSPP